MTKTIPLTNSQRVAASRQRRLEELEQLRQFKADALSGQGLAAAQHTIDILTGMVANLQQENLRFILEISNLKTSLAGTRKAR